MRRREVIALAPDTAPLKGTFYLRAFEQAAASLDVEPITSFVHSTGEIEGAIAGLGQESNGA